MKTQWKRSAGDPVREEVHIRADGRELGGDLAIPSAASGLVLFAHGSGSSRHSPRNQFVARTLRQAGLATLLFDLLTKEEEAIDWHTSQLRFDIGLLARRLVAATEWLSSEGLDEMAVGYFGSSTGGGAALVAAAEVGEKAGAVVSRGGRPDMAEDALEKVRCPTLLVVGGHDQVVLELNEEAYRRLQCSKELKVVPGASHLFEEPGAIESVAQTAADWFTRHLHPVHERG